MSAGDEYPDDDEWDGEDDEHDYYCECDTCTLNRQFDECGRMPADLGGGCSLAGTEYCDWECTLRDRELEDEEE